MTRECLGRRDRMRIYGTEYARVKRINAKSCCRLNLPGTFRPLRLRTMKREGLSIGDAGKFFASTTASPCATPMPGLRNSDWLRLTDWGQFSTKGRRWRRCLGPCGGGSRTSYRVPRWDRPQASPSLGGSCGSAEMRHAGFAGQGQVPRKSRTTTASLHSQYRDASSE